MTDGRQRMDVDIVCVGFGPATGGFLTTIAREVVNEDGTPRLESRVAPGLPLQVLCFERADDLGVGVSGVVTRARGIRASFPGFDPADIPLATRVAHEQLVYLLDPVGASRRSRPVRMLDRCLRAGRGLLVEHDGVALPFVPGFLQKHDGFVSSIGQFSQWVSGQLMATGAAQIWPGSPAAEPLYTDDRVVGIRLVDQGTDVRGEPAVGFMPGMDVRAALTVVGDGPAGAVGRALDAKFGLPEGHVRDEWALGMKMVVDLDEGVELEPGTVIHTFGFPEPRPYRLPLPPALDVASVPVALAQRRNPPVMGREVGSGVGTKGRAVPGGRRLRAHRRRLGQHERADRLRRG